MNKLQLVTCRLVQACEGNPIASTVVIMMFYIMFNVVEALVETVIFGKRFEHWLDIVFSLITIAYSAYAVYWCAIFNSAKREG